MTIFIRTCVCFCLCSLLLPASSLLARPSLQYYIGMPYITNPLGDGQRSRYSPGPIVREDGFDCTTYVETMLSQYRTKHYKENFNLNILKIRYTDTEPSFFSRTHFMEYHWIPNAMKHKLISPFLTKYVQYSDFHINLQAWFLGNTFAIHKDKLYTKKVMQLPHTAAASIPYVPVRHLTVDFMRTLQDFMLVFFLKKLPQNAWAGLEEEQTVVTHMGLLIDGELYHASSRRKKVSQLDFLEYLQESKNIVGVSFYTIH